MAKMANNLMDREVYIQANLELYQSNRPFVISKHMGAKRKKYFEKSLWSSVEMGLLKRFLEGPIPDFLKVYLGQKDGQGQSMYYDGLLSYIEAHTKTTALSFDKLDYLFRIYSALISAVLVVNLAHYFVKKWASRFRIWLRCTKQKLVSLARKLCDLKRQFALLLSASFNRINFMS